ncbi:hypothetical protein BIY24_05280 [Halobacteriovorax marinus]|nr:hypothetical protein [Halobacteriovorax marinus]ATH07369.1 hypothetical protein BIY24_05280 [Halobacteriovorax marinus]
MIPRMQIVKKDDSITLFGDFGEDGMGIEEVKDYFANWLQSYPQEDIEEKKLYISSLDGKKEELKLH